MIYIRLLFLIIRCQFWGLTDGYKSTRDILKVGTSFQSLDIFTNLTYILCIRKSNHTVQCDWKWNVKSIFVIYYFDSKKNDYRTLFQRLVPSDSESAPSVRTYEYWFRLFKSDDFDLKGKECSGQLKKFEDTELQVLLDENSAWMFEALSSKSNVFDRN